MPYEISIGENLATCNYVSLEAEFFEETDTHKKPIRVSYNIIERFHQDITFRAYIESQEHGNSRAKA